MTVSGTESSNRGSREAVLESVTSLENKVNGFSACLRLSPWNVCFLSGFPLTVFLSCNFILVLISNYY